MSVSQDAILRDNLTDKSLDKSPSGDTRDSSEPKGQELNYAARVLLDQTQMQVDDRLAPYHFLSSIADPKTSSSGYEGEIVMNSEANAASDKKLITLSRREIEVLSLAARGQTYDDMSKYMSITKDTAKAHMENARHKLGAINKSHAIAIAVPLGYVKL